MEHRFEIGDKVVDVKSDVAGVVAGIGQPAGYGAVYAVKLADGAFTAVRERHLRPGGVDRQMLREAVLGTGVVPTAEQLNDLVAVIENTMAEIAAMNLLKAAAADPE